MRTPTEDLIVTLKDKAHVIREKSGDPGKYYLANIGYEDADIYELAARTIQLLIDQLRTEVKG